MPKRFGQFKLAAFIALRVARSKRRSALSLITLISILGVAVGVMALTVVLAVSDGFQQAFQDRILGLFPHLVVTRTSSIFTDYDPVLDTIRQTPGVSGATPLTHDEMMVAHGPHRAGATVQGVDIHTVGTVLDLDLLIRKDDDTPILQALDDRPTLRDRAGTLHLSNLVQGARWTLIVPPGSQPSTTDSPAALLLSDDTPPPEPDHFRLQLLDLRAHPTPLSLELLAGTAADRYALETPIELPHSAPGRWSVPLELPKGAFRLSLTSEHFDLRAKRHYHLLLFDGPNGHPQSQLLVSEAHSIPDQHMALRLVDLRPSNQKPQAWHDDTGLITTLAPGEHTDYIHRPAALPGVLLGYALAEKLRTQIGDTLTFVTPLRGVDSKGLGSYGSLPSSSQFRVVGIFEAGFYDHDSRLAIVNIEVVQRLINRGKQIRSIAVKSDSLDALNATKSNLRRALDPLPLTDFLERSVDFETKLSQLSRELSPDEAPPAPLLSHMRKLSELSNHVRFQGMSTATYHQFEIFDWRQKNNNLFSALELQKLVLTIFFFIITLVGSFVVVGSQTMIVHDKTADIAILKTMGATDGLIRLVFTLQGLFVASIGVLAGLALGLGIIALIRSIDYQLPASVYLIDHLPANIDALELSLISLGALLSTLLTTQISAKRAAQKTPIAGLRQVD